MSSVKREMLKDLALSLFNICPEPPLDPGKLVVLVKLQGLLGLGAREKLEVSRNHHHRHLTSTRLQILKVGSPSTREAQSACPGRPLDPDQTLGRREDSCALFIVNVFGIFH